MQTNLSIKTLVRSAYFAFAKFSFKHILIANIYKATLLTCKNTTEVVFMC